MAVSLSYTVGIDRLAAIYDLHVDYYIDGYSDPETGEYFGDTSWVASLYRVPGGFVGGTGGYASEGDSVTLGLIADAQPGSWRYQLTFNAYSTFSADTAAFTWNIYSTAFDATPQVITASNAVDIIIGSSADDVLRGLAGDDVIDGGDGNDMVDGGGGNDRLDGGLGDDIMAGGKDHDTYIVESVSDIVAERINEGYDTIFASVSYVMATNVERLVLTGGAAINGTGATGNERIDGNTAANILSGLDGDDELHGGAGKDKLYGGNDNDMLDGGTDANSMEGGAGNDIYIVDSRSDVVTESLNAGEDTVRVTTLSSYTLGLNLEKLQWIGTGNFRGVGNDLDNTSTGGSANDTLEGGNGGDLLEGLNGNDKLIGGAGADALSGGNGVDTASYATSSLAVTVNLGTGKGSGGDAQGDTLIGVENVVGSNGNDTLIGNQIANNLSGGLGIDTINGSGGNDVIIGGAGGDFLDGGAGIDTLSYTGFNIAVIVDLSIQLGTQHGGDAEGDEIANFENVIGSNGNDTLSGDDKANSLTGGAGNDTINGAEGNDTITSGTDGDNLDGGNDTDTVSYSGSALSVTVNLGLQIAYGGDAQGDTLANFENARGSDRDDTLTGSDGKNTLSGGAGADTIDGADGDDTIIGGAGGDLSGGTGIDTLSYSGSAGGVVVNLLTQTVYATDAQGDAISDFENVTGSSHGDWILGDDNANVLQGGDGFDFLGGGKGNDRMAGGDKADTFAFGTGDGKDTITDFLDSLSSQETIVLSLGTAFDTFAEVMAVAHASGSSLQNTVLQFGANTSLTLVNVKTWWLSADNFKF